MARVVWKPGAVPPKWHGRVQWWYDGDTLLVRDGALRHVVRLFGCDAPEVGQQGFALAREFLRGRTDKGNCEVTPICLDRYGRVVARLRSPGNLDVSLELIAAGMAWHDVRYARLETAYAAAQEAARAAKLGIWSRIPWGFAPWVWRRRAGVYG